MDKGSYNFQRPLGHHEIFPSELIDFLNQEANQWYMYAATSTEDKKFQVRIGKKRFRVTHGKEIVYEGKEMLIAISVYNNIFGLPQDQPKLDN